MAADFGRAWRTGRLGQAYLFAGPRGIGKRLFAHELAKAILCEARTVDRLEACDTCASCLQLDAGAHPDLFTLEREEGNPEILIDPVRDFCRELSLKSARGGWKVGILDDADDLIAIAANCFLKTLEEPPAQSLLILIGTETERQLPTILSRCQVVRFRRLTDEFVDQLLRERGIEDSGLRKRLIAMSAGSPGEAMALADPAFWEFRKRLIDGIAKARPETTELAREWMKFAEEAGKEGTAQRMRAALALKLLIEFFREALVLSVGGSSNLADAEELGALGKVANRLRTEGILEMLDRCVESDFQIERRMQLVLVLEALMDRLGQKVAGTRSA